MKRWGLGITLLFATTASNAAAVLPNITYTLGDHPDASLQNLPDITYGLRVDSISTFGIGGDATNAAKTFSTTQETASVSLLWDNMGDSDNTNDVATITGQLSRNSDNSIWDVSYTLTDIIAAADGFKAETGSGTISNGSDVFNIQGQQDNNGYIFLALGDGHRLSGDYSSEVGRGWIEPQAGSANTTDDWLVTLTPVPVPAALPLLFSGLAGFAFIGRRKRA